MAFQYRQPNVVLALTSHAHAPPLRPAPQLKYDLRTVPNPPKAIRDAYTGVSKRLRDHMLEHDMFVELLRRAEVEILATVESMVELSRADKELVDKTSREEVMSEKDERKNDEDIFESGAETVHEDEDGGELEAIVNYSHRLVLTVGIFCARGQHRSVAFAEELGRVSWPKDWEVVVSHRDLGQKRGGAKARGGSYRKITGADILQHE